MLDNATYMNIIGIIKLLATEGQLGPGVSKKQNGENIRFNNNSLMFSHIIQKHRFASKLQQLLHPLKLKTIRCS